MKITDIIQLKQLEGKLNAARDLSLSNAQTAHSDIVFADLGRMLPGVGKSHCVGCTAPKLIVLNKKTWQPVEVCRECVNAIRTASLNSKPGNSIRVNEVLDYDDMGMVVGMSSIMLPVKEASSLIALGTLQVDDVTNKVTA